MKRPLQINIHKESDSEDFANENLDPNIFFLNRNNRETLSQNDVVVKD